MGSVHTITTAPFSDPEGSRNDNLWIAVDREGTTCIEYFTPVFDVSFSQNEGFFVDGGNIYYEGDLDVNWEVISSAGGNSTVRFYGLDRLEGKSVDGVFRGFDMGSAVVSSGYAEFTFEDGLLSEAGAIELVQTERIAATTLNFNSLYISSVNQTNPNALGSGCAQSPIITGEDGEKYFISGGKSGIGGDPNVLVIRDASDCTVAFSKSAATIESEADAAGITAPGGDIGSGIVELRAVAVPDTPYIIVIGTMYTGS